MCETVALCWVWYARLVRGGRDPSGFLGTLAGYGAAAVAAGRRACGQEPARDVLSSVCRSSVCRRRRGFTVAPLPGEAADGAPPADALRDNTRTPVPDQVQFRCDFPAWRARLRPRDRRLVDRLAAGHRAADVAAEFGLTAGRVSQLRKQFYRDYAAFCGGGE